MDISQIRREYSKTKLTKKSVREDPVEQFDIWLDEAIKSECKEPTAMVVSTVSKDNKPSSRTVLLKGIDNGEFIFYTNYQSRKGQQIEHNPNVAALFYWAELERQVCIEGTVRKTSPEESDAYFQTRPWKSRIGAIISPQSQPIESRNVIVKAFILEMTKHAKSVPRPDHWGGYRIRPNRIEFWQGRPNRLHDRVLFELMEDGSWQIHRLAP